MLTRELVLRALYNDLSAELQGLERVTQMAIDEATGSESKAENKYDTRGLEASYLAAGQAERVVALRRLVSWLKVPPKPTPDLVGLGSLVELEGDSSRWLLILPDGGGTRVRVEGVEVLCLTPDSPLGRDLVGSEDGDDVEVGGVEYSVRCVPSA